METFDMTGCINDFCRLKHGMETDVFRVSLVSMATVQASRDLRCYVL